MKYTSEFGGALPGVPSHLPHASEPVFHFRLWSHLYQYPSDPSSAVLGNVICRSDWIKEIHQQEILAEIPSDIVQKLKDTVFQWLRRQPSNPVYQESLIGNKPYIPNDDDFREISIACVETFLGVAPSGWIKLGHMSMWLEMFRGRYGDRF